jgi:hypothetical protein
MVIRPGRVYDYRLRAQTREVTMRKTDLGSVLVAVAISVSYLGCGSEGGGASGMGGSGATGSGGNVGTGGTTEPVTALSFDAETVLPASAGAAVAVAFGTQFGALMSRLELFGGLPPRSVQAAIVPKDTTPISGLCSMGSAVLDWSGALAEGETVMVTLQGCEGTALVAGPADGTISFEVDSVDPSATVFSGTATLDLTSPGTVVAGTFSVNTNRANVFLGEQAPTDRMNVTQAGQRMTIECFDIYQRYNEFYRPLALATVDNQIFTINDYEATPANTRFDLSSGVPVVGSVQLLSGVGSGVPCRNAMPQGDGSSCLITFNAGGCVDIACTDAGGGSITRSAMWNDLLSFDFLAASETPCGS